MNKHMKIKNKKKQLMKMLMMMKKNFKNKNN